VRRERAPAHHELGRHGTHFQPQEILHLARQDDQGDPAREADGDRIGDELDRGAQTREAEPHQDDPRHEGRHGEALHAVPLHDGVHDHDERARRPADLHP
jgi:hypothetical protein